MVVSELQKATNLVYQIITPTIIVFGFFCNTSCFILMRRNVMKNKVMSFYLGLLAIYDNLALLFPGIRRWIQFTFGFDLEIYLNCGGYTALHVTFYQLSCWLAVIIACDRVLCVYLQKTERIINLKKAKILCIIQATGVIFYAAFWAVYSKPVDLSTLNNTPIYMYPCDMTSQVAVLNWVDVSLYCFVPTLVLSLTSLLILKRLKRAAIMMKRNSQQQKLNRMLLLIALLFFITTIPLNLIFITANYLDLLNPQLFAKVMIATAVAENIALLNNSLNPVIYMSTNKRYQTGMRKLYTKCVKKRTSIVSPKIFSTNNDVTSHEVS